FPSLGVERELGEIVGQTDPAAFLTREVVHEVLARPESAYLARRMCWVFTAGGLDVCSLTVTDARITEYLEVSSPGENRMVVLVADARARGCLPGTPEVD